MEFIDILLPTKCQLVNVYSAFKELIGFRFDQRRFIFHNPKACVNEKTLQHLLGAGERDWLSGVFGNGAFSYKTLI